MATHSADVTRQMLNILVAVAAGKTFKSPAGVVPKMVDMGLLDYGEGDVVLTAAGAELAREETEKRESKRRSSKRKASKRSSRKTSKRSKAKVSTKSSAKKSSKRSSARKSPAKTSKGSKRSSAKKTSPRRSSARKSQRTTAVRRGPYTESDVARFNALTWYPRTVEQWNASYWEDVDQLTGWAMANLERWGVEEVPEDVDKALARYQRALYQQGMASIRSREVAPPWTVTGRSGYRGKPEKARAIDEKAYEAAKRARHGVEKAVGRYSPRAAISSDDPEAITKLQAKITMLEATQEMMKAANAIVRKKKLTDDQKVTQLSAIDGISAATARKLLEPDYMGRLGFPAYELQNNNANIRRLKERVAELQKRSEMADRQFEFEGGTIEMNVADNRVQIFFDGKPDEPIRKDLKRHGFKWARSVGAWQRMLSEDALYWAKDVLAKHGMPVTETTEQAAAPEEPKAPDTGAFGAMFASIETMDERRAEREEKFQAEAEAISTAPDPRATATRKRVAPELLITDDDAFAKLTELEGKAWAKREEADAAEPNTFFDARDAFRILIDDGLVGNKIKDPDTGELREILIGDITGSAGFGGANDEIYVVLSDGRIALFADTADAGKVAKARKVLTVLGDAEPKSSKRKSSARASSLAKKSPLAEMLLSLRPDDEFEIKRANKTKKIKIVSEPEVVGNLIRVHTWPGGGNLTWRAGDDAITYRPTLVTPSVPLQELKIVRSVDEKAEAKIQAFRNIVESKSMAEIEGVEVDMWTASAVVNVYDGLSPENQAKFMSKSVPEIIDITLKLINR